MNGRRFAAAAMLGMVALLGVLLVGPSGAAAQTAPAATVEPGYLGVLADETGESTGGILVRDLAASGPAQAAGMIVGDVITSIDGRAATKVDDMATLLAGRPAGDEVTFVIRRGGEVRRVEVRLGKRPPGNFGRVAPNTSAPGAWVASTPQGNATAPAPTKTIPPTVAPKIATRPNPLPPETLPEPGVAPAVPGFEPSAPSGALLGVRAVPVSPELQRALNLPEARGALVVEVRPGSPAQKAGLPLEAVVTAIDGRRVDSPQQLADAVNERSPGSEIRLSYFRFGQLQEKAVRLGGTSAAAPTAGELPRINPQPIFQAPPATLPVPIAPSPAVSTPPAVVTAIKPESEADAIKRQIRELEARLAEIEKQPSSKPPAKKP